MTIHAIYKYMDPMKKLIDAAPKFNTPGDEVDAEDFSFTN